MVFLAKNCLLLNVHYVSTFIKPGRLTGTLNWPFTPQKCLFAYSTHSQKMTD